MESVKTINIEINDIKNTIANLLYGTVEIRTNLNKKYIYVHYRESGVLKTKYVGEFSDEMVNLIIRNNNKVKELKKRLKELEKQLSAFDVVEKDVNEDIQINIALAKKYLVDSIYKQSVLEGVATTYSDTETLVNEGIVHNMSANDVQKIVNLKHAWEFVMDFDVVCYPTNYAILCQINGLVEEGLSFVAGRIRSVPVTISGSSYIPPIPFEYSVKEELDLIINNQDYNDIEKAARLIAYTMKTQTFLDGNKRTAVIFGNHYLISHGLGLMVVPVEKLPEYRKLLIDYYEDKSEKLIPFFMNECYIPLK